MDHYLSPISITFLLVAIHSTMKETRYLEAQPFFLTPCCNCQPLCLFIGPQWAKPRLLITLKKPGKCASFWYVSSKCYKYPYDDVYVKNSNHYLISSPLIVSLSWFEFCFAFMLMVNDFIYFEMIPKFVSWRYSYFLGF